MAQNYVEILVKSRDEAKPDLDELKAKLQDLSHQVATARANVDDTDAAAKLDRMQAKLLDLDRKTANPKISMSGALRAEADIHAVEAAMDDLSKKEDEVSAKTSGQGLLSKIVNGAAGGASGFGPALLGPLLALSPAIATLGGVAAGAATGIGGAFVAGGAAVGAFGAVAKPVLADALTASQAVQKAQDAYTAAIDHGAKQAAAYKTEQTAIAKAYAEMSPAQIALSKQLGDMGNAWQAVKAAETPVVAGALQPWLQTITSLMGSLSPIITRVSTVIGDLGSQFQGLINSSVFTTFRDFIAGTGSMAVNAAGNTIISLIQAFITLLPKFNPLIQEAIGWLGNLGPAIDKWAASQSTADAITKFMTWFNQNGPVVSGLLKNVGDALKALAPGLAAGGMTELKLISDFFSLIAKLPPSLAKPLLDVAGVLLTLNKLGVIKLGLQLVGPGAGAAAAEAGGAAGLWAKLLPGVRLVGGALVATLVVEAVLKNTKTSNGGNWWDNPFGGASPDDKVKGAKPNALSSWDQLGKDIQHDFDTILAGAKLWGSNMTGAISTTWNNIISGAKLWATGMASSVSTTWNNIVAGAKTWATSIVSSVKTAWDNIVAGAKTWGSGIISTIKTTWDNIVAGAKTWVSNMTTEGENVLKWFQGLPGKITSAVASFPTLLVNAGKSLLTGLISGIESEVANVINTVESVGSNILSSIKSKLGISSPSRMFHEIGERCMEGLMNGFNSRQGDLRLQMNGLAHIVTGANGVFGISGGNVGAAGGVRLQVMPGGGSAFEQFMVMSLRNYVRVRGGSVQSAFGH